MVATTAQLYLKNPKTQVLLRFKYCGVSAVFGDLNLLQWLRLEIRLNAFCRSTIPQKQRVKQSALKRLSIVKSGVFTPTGLLAHSFHLHFSRPSINLSSNSLLPINHSSKTTHRHHSQCSNNEYYITYTLTTDPRSWSGFIVLDYRS